MELCAQAAVEQDSDRLLILVHEINRLLEEKERRLKKRGNQSELPDDPNERTLKWRAPKKEGRSGQSRKCLALRLLRRSKC